MSPENKRIIISGFYGFENLGDEAILKSLITKFRDRFSESAVRVLVLSNSPESTRRRYGVEAIGRWKLLKIVKELKNSDLLISGGGGLLQDKTSTRSLWYYLTILNLAHLTGTPAYILGQGIGPVQRSVNRALLKGSLKRIRGALVRDQASLDLLEEMDVFKGTLKGPDLAFLYPYKKKSRIPTVFQGEKPVIGVAIKDLNEGRGNAIHALAEGLDSLAGEIGGTTALFSTHFSADRGMCQDLKEALESPSRIIHTAHVTPAELITMISEAELLIGGRLHALEFALLATTPVIGVSYDPKMDHFVQSLEEYDTDLSIKLWHPEDMDRSEEFKHDLFRLLERRDFIRGQMGRTLIRIQGEAEGQLNKMLDRIEEELENNEETP